MILHDRSLTRLFKLPSAPDVSHTSGAATPDSHETCKWIIHEPRVNSRVQSKQTAVYKDTVSVGLHLQFNIILKYQNYPVCLSQYSEQ